MTIELKIPHVGESIQEVQIGRWLKREGDHVKEDEDVVEVETDKATMDLPAPAAGVIQQILKQEGETAAVGETIAYLEETDGSPAADAEPFKRKRPSEKTPKKPRAVEPPASEDTAAKVQPGKDVESSSSEKQSQYKNKKPVTDEPMQTAVESLRERESDGADDQQEEVVPMTLIRRRIAERLVEAQQSAALLTTFNEIDMSSVMHLRQKYGEAFLDRYGVKLGFMSFFVKAVIDALRSCPALNAEIRRTDIIYRNYFHIGIAVATDRGLVVPVLRHAERMSFAEVEMAIGEYAKKARQNDLRPDDLTGGTFTISNGGIYGSLLSTPIVNPPQSGVLGMHAIEDRPVARGGQVVIRPMMYVALTYDHRIVDGREAVGFLVRVKEAVEEPSRMLLET